MSTSKAENTQATPDSAADASRSSHAPSESSARERKGAAGSDRSPDELIAEAGQSIDDLIEDVEAVCGSDRADEPVPEEYEIPEQAPIRSADAARDPALQEIDEALADDVESLLHGDFEAVSAVLDDVFDDRTSTRQEASEASSRAEELSDSRPDDSEPAIDAPTVSATPATGTRPAAESEDEPSAPETDGIAPEASDSLADASVASPDRVDLTADVHAEPEEPPASEPARESRDEVDAPAAPEPGEASPPAPPHEPVDSAPAETSPAAESEIEAQIEPDPADSGRVPGRPSVPGNQLQSGLEAALLPLARVMSVPMAFVPPRIRPMVDWIALSLIFWVPIVWIVALFIV
jgi:hypothetical protein